MDQDHLDERALQLPSILVEDINIDELDHFVIQHQKSRTNNYDDDMSHMTSAKSHDLHNIDDNTIRGSSLYSPITLKSGVLLQNLINEFNNHSPQNISNKK